MKRAKREVFRFKSAATPTDEELAAFANLSDQEQRDIIDAELDKGLHSGFSEKSVTDILNEVKARHRKHAV